VLCPVLLGLGGQPEHNDRRLTINSLGGDFDTAISGCQDRSDLLELVGVSCHEYYGAMSLILCLDTVYVPNDAML
jgi:hypothetical protein